MQERQQNKGFTLIEVLIAVTILSIVAAPMLHSFVTSARINAKSKRLLNASTLSQSIMEDLKAGDLDEIAAEYDWYDAAGDEITKTYDAEGKLEFITQQDSYEFRKEGVSGGSGIYDVKIFLDKNAVSGTKNLANLTSMNQSDCGYFAQSENMDAKAASEFKMRNEAYVFDAVAQKTKEEFQSMMNRTITVHLKSDGTNQSAEVTYLYEIPRGYTAEEERIYSESVQIFDNLVSEQDLKAVYLYYYPRYGTGTDMLTINNQADLEIPVYLIRMDVEDPGAVLEQIPTISVTEASLDSENKSHLTICTNLESGKYNLASSSIRMTDLGNSKDEVVLYDVKIEVYRQNDTAYDADHLISTYTGSFMDSSDKTE